VGVLDAVEERDVTLHIRNHPTIAGVDCKVLRDLLRRSHGTLYPQWLSHKLGLSGERAAQIIEDLIKEGYLERGRDKDSCCSVTLKGRELVRASAACLLKRSTAESAIASFMDRVRQVNESPKYFCYVTKIALFGSFLGHADRIGDVDVAVDIQPRRLLGRNWVERTLEYARNSGRSFSSFEAELDWPRKEIQLLLKARKRAISIQSWYSFTHMRKPNGFRYGVLHGDSEEIQRDLKAAEMERSREDAQDS